MSTTRTDLATELGQARRRLAALERMPKKGARQQRLMAAVNTGQLIYEYPKAHTHGYIHQATISVPPVNHPIFIIMFAVGRNQDLDGAKFNATVRLSAREDQFQDGQHSRFSQEYTFTEETGDLWEGQLLRADWIHSFRSGWDAHVEPSRIDVELKTNSLTPSSQGFYIQPVVYPPRMCLAVSRVDAWSPDYKPELREVPAS
ncbi:hypothetical protein O1L55_20765 [Streptomyces albulus]|nr:hypothetical protein [Streptomyces noursei]